MQDKLNIIFGHTSCVSSEDLFRYHRKELNSEQAHAVEKHLIDCEMCSDELEGLILMDTPKGEKAFAAVTSDIDNRIAGVKIIKARFNWKRALAVAASIVVLLGCIALIYNLIPAINNKNIAQVSEDEYKVVEDQEKESLKETESIVEKIGAEESGMAITEKTDNLEQTTVAGAEEYDLTEATMSRTLAYDASPEKRNMEDTDDNRYADDELLDSPGSVANQNQIENQKEGSDRKSNENAASGNSSGYRYDQSGLNSSSAIDKINTNADSDKSTESNNAVISDYTVSRNMEKAAAPKEEAVAEMVLSREAEEKSKLDKSKDSAIELDLVSEVKSGKGESRSSKKQRSSSTVERDEANLLVPANASFENEVELPIESSETSGDNLNGLSGGAAIAEVNNYESEINRALLFYNAGNKDSSLYYFNELFKVYPSDDRVAFYTGLSLVDAGRTDEAIAILKRVSDNISSEYQHAAMWQLSQLLIKKDQVIEAKALLLKLLDSADFKDKAQKSLQEISN